MLWVLLGIGIVTLVTWAQYDKYLRSRHIEAVLNGPVRVNVESGIYFVPTCSQYDSISQKNLVEVRTIREAEEGGARRAHNCDGDDFQIREANESGRYEYLRDLPQDRDDPRQ